MVIGLPVWEGKMEWTGMGRGDGISKRRRPIHMHFGSPRRIVIWTFVSKLWITGGLFVAYIVL